MNRMMQVPHLRNHYSNLVMQFLKEQVENINTDMSILDIGCGHMRNLKLFELLGFKELHALDIDPTDNPLDVKYKTFTQHNIVNKLPYEDRSFDIVLCNYVLMFIKPESMQEVVADIFRVSRNYVILETARRKDFNTKSTCYTNYSFEEILRFVPTEFEIIKLRNYREKLIARRLYG